VRKPRIVNLRSVHEALGRDNFAYRHDVASTAQAR
jgi:hypothetical protein